MSGINLSKQNLQDIYTKIELLNKDDLVIDELQGIIINGNISIDSTSDTRRTCNLDILLNNKNLIPNDRSSIIWFDKKFKLYVGIKNFSSGEVEWFNKGIYYFTNPNIDLSESEATISITGVDKMCVYTSDFDGCLTYKTKITSGTPMFDTIKNLISLVGETNYVINDVENLSIPYDISKEADSDIIDILIEIRDLYMGYEFFYTEDGTFVWQKIKDRKNDNVQYIYDEDDKLVINYSNKPDFSNIKNKVVIWGKQFEDKEQITSTLLNKNNNKFGIDYIGERPYVICDDTIQTQEQANLRAEYEMYLHSNLNETVSLESIQILDLDVNKIITINKSYCGINGNFLIERLSYQLGDSGTMTIEAKKLYY